MAIEICDSCQLPILPYDPFNESQAVCVCGSHEVEDEELDELGSDNDDHALI